MSGGAHAAAADDAVTHLERRLYFSTAHFYLRSGCPALAVEVLSKLPNRVVDVSEKSSRKASRSGVAKTEVETGTFEGTNSSLDWSQPVPKDRKKPEVPLKEVKEATDVIDWSSPLVSGPPKMDDDDDELKLEWSDDPDTDDEDDEVPKKGESEAAHVL